MNDDLENNKKITKEAFNEWCTGSFGRDYAREYLWEILTKEYPIEVALEDIYSFMKDSNKDD